MKNVGRVLGLLELDAAIRRIGPTSEMTLICGQSSRRNVADPLGFHRPANYPDPTERPVKDDHTGMVSGDRLSIMLTGPRPMVTDTAAVQLNGEIDNSNAEQVAGLAEALGDATVIILDMSGVSFLGAAGLTALLRLAARLSLAGRHLVLTGTDHHPVRRPIEICELDAVLDCRPITAAGSEKSST